MTKSIKKILAVGMSILALSSVVSVTAFAANKDYSFTVTTSQNSGMAFSAANPKDDDEQTAYVYTESGNIISSDLFYMAVYKSPQTASKYKVTPWTRVKSNNGRYLIDYYSSQKRVKGSYNYLCGDTDKYTVSVEGYWYS